MSDYRINVRFHDDNEEERRAAEYLKTLHRSRNQFVVDAVQRFQILRRSSFLFVVIMETDIDPVVAHKPSSAFSCASARYSYPLAAAQMSSTNFTRSALTLPKFFTRQPPPPVI